MEEFSKNSGSTRKPPIKRRIVLSVLALAAAVSLLTGCYPKYDFSPDYEDGYSLVESSSQSVTYEDTSSSSTVSPVTSSSSFSSSFSSSYPSSTFTESFVPNSTRSSSTYTFSSAEPVTAPIPSYTPQRTKPLNTKSEEFVPYTTGNSELNFSSYSTPYLFDFRTRMTVGYSVHDYKNQLPVEADYGIMGKFDGSVISVKTYDYTGKNLSVVSSCLEPLDAYVTVGKENVLFGPVARTTDLFDLPNGLYRISVTFSNSNTAELYFLVNGDEYLFCQMLMASTSTIHSNYNIDMIRARRAHVFRLLDEWDVTPQNSLSVDIIKYPSIDYYYNGELYWRCDTDLWAQLSDDLVKPSWSDERKAYVICDWISQNIAYDTYVSDVIEASRHIKFNDSTGKYSVYNLRCGVCRDFGQIVAIMLRQQGIPTDVIANDTHLWNVVYLNGRWIEVDLCYSQTKFVDGVDTTIRRDSGNSYYGLLNMCGQNNGNDYGTSLHKYLYMGQESFD